MAAEGDNTTAVLHHARPMRQVPIPRPPVSAALRAARLEAAEEETAWEQEQDRLDQEPDVEDEQGGPVDTAKDLAEQLKKRLRARQKYDSKQHRVMGPMFEARALTRIAARPERGYLYLADSGTGKSTAFQYSVHGRAADLISVQNLQNVTTVFKALMHPNTAIRHAVADMLRQVAARLSPGPAPAAVEQPQQQFMQQQQQFLLPQQQFMQQQQQFLHPQQQFMQPQNPAMSVDHQVRSTSLRKQPAKRGSSGSASRGAKRGRNMLAPGRAEATQHDTQQSPHGLGQQQQNATQLLFGLHAETVNVDQSPDMGEHHAMQPPQSPDPSPQQHDPSQGHQHQFQQQQQQDHPNYQPLQPQQPPAELFTNVQAPSVQQVNNPTGLSGTDIQSGQRTTSTSTLTGLQQQQQPAFVSATHPVPSSQEGHQVVGTGGQSGQRMPPLSSSTLPRTQQQRQQQHQQQPRWHPLQQHQQQQQMSQQAWCAAPSQPWQQRRENLQMPVIQQTDVMPCMDGTGVQRGQRTPLLSTGVLAPTATPQERLGQQPRPQQQDQPQRQPQQAYQQLQPALLRPQQPSTGPFTTLRLPADQGIGIGRQAGERMPPSSSSTLAGMQQASHQTPQLNAPISAARTGQLMGQQRAVSSTSRPAVVFAQDQMQQLQQVMGLSSGFNVVAVPPPRAPVCPTGSASGTLGGVCVEDLLAASVARILSVGGD